MLKLPGVTGLEHTTPGFDPEVVDTISGHQFPGDSDGHPTGVPDNVPASLRSFAFQPVDTRFMNEYVQVILLGIVQGIAEFLPISSSGHLVLSEQILGWAGGGPSVAAGKDVEVMLHLGTLLAIVLVYWRDLQRIAFQPRTLLLLFVATLPAAICGLAFEDWFDQAFDTPLVAGFGLLMTAVLLMAGQSWERARFTDERLPWVCGILIGCFQAAALVPGISRSGSTIAGGLLTGVDRISATRFSFLLAIPVTLGAVLLTGKRIWETGESTAQPGTLIVGVIVSFVTGVITLRWLIRIISQRRLHWFAIYCAVVGTVTILVCGAGPSRVTSEGPGVVPPSSIQAESSTGQPSHPER